MKSHKDLDVWKKSIKLAKDVYKLIEILPKEERYGLSEQMKRAVISIPSNIAEGAARESEKEFVRFLYIALGSANELDTQIEICKELNFKSVDSNQLNQIQTEISTISKMIYGLILNLKRRIKQ